MLHPSCSNREGGAGLPLVRLWDLGTWVVQMTLENAQTNVLPA